MLSRIVRARSPTKPFAHAADGSTDAVRQKVNRTVISRWEGRLKPIYDRRSQMFSPRVSEIDQTVKSYLGISLVKWGRRSPTENKAFSLQRRWYRNDSFRTAYHGVDYGTVVSSRNCGRHHSPSGLWQSATGSLSIQ